MSDIKYQIEFGGPPLLKSGPLRSTTLYSFGPSGCPYGPWLRITGPVVGVIFLPSTDVLGDQPSMLTALLYNAR